MKQIFVVLAAVVILALAGCEARRADVIGTWEAIQGNQVLTLDLRSDSTFVMDTGQFTGDGTYSVDAEDRIVLAPEGALATVMPGGFTGTVDRTVLNLCSPSGVCTPFERAP
jgi:hypothetical protein